MTDQVQQPAEAVEAPAQEPVVENQSPEQAEPAADATPKEPDAASETRKALRGVQKRIDELTRQRYEAEERGRQEAEHWRRQAAELHEQLQSTQRASQRPTLESSGNDFERYVADSARYEAAIAAQTQLQERERVWYETQQAQQQQAMRQQQVAAYQQAVQARVSEATKKFPDFMEVVTAAELPGMQGTPAFNAAMESDHFAELAMYLGKNPEKAHQILALPPISQVREIGRLEARIAAGQITTKAPPPPGTVGSNSPAGVDPRRMTDDEWLAWRNKDIAAKRKR
jgi:predicted XRE-type DNA-binding protein